MFKECKFRYATYYEANKCSAILNPGEEQLIVPCGYASLNTNVCPIAKYAKGEISLEEANRVLAQLHIDHRGPRLP